LQAISLALYDSAMIRLLTAILYCALSLPSLAAPLFGQPKIPLLDYQLLDTQPHNVNSFTQGLVFEAPYFYESSGLYGKSFITRYSPQKKEQRVIISATLFAEGLTIIGQQLYLLTWRKGILQVYNKQTLALQKTLHYRGEGWGLTSDGHQLIMSDGSNRIRFRDPHTLEIKRQLTIKGLDKLNELEYTQDIIWANRWFDNAIYAISASNGCILGKVNLTALRHHSVTPDHRNVLNGIAYDHQQQGFWVTGKFWPTRYLIRIETPSDTHCI